jgi:membrane-bound metal-dependent hydrolase YbcI (DUF457 family)
VGHLAAGYILSKLASKATKTNINTPLVLMFSVLPDIDLLIPFLEHRGPTHSLIAEILVFIPLFVLYGKKAAPYLLALIQHPLIGDYIFGGRMQLLWPITHQHYGIEVGIETQTNIAAELTLFLFSTILLLKTKDLNKLLQPHHSNLILTIPTLTTIIPTFFKFPLPVPLTLIPSHLFYAAIFTAAITIDLNKIRKSLIPPS